MFEDSNSKSCKKDCSKPPIRNRRKIKKASKKNVDLFIEDDIKQAIPTLPIEMILQIISKLTNFNDRINCTLLSKDIRDLMFKSPKMMKNVNFRFKTSTIADWKDFVMRQGSYMKNIVIELCPNYHIILAYVLMMLPNVEELELFEDEKKHIRDSHEAAADNPEHKVELTKLKSLKINTKDIQKFIKITKNVTNLKNLTIIYDSLNCDLPMYELICQQEALRNLKILNTQDNNLSFPTSDISQSIKFRLKTFTLHVSRFSRENENLAQFLAIHAGTLEELDFDFAIHPKVCEVIVGKMTRLAKLTHRSGISSQIYQLHPQNKSIKFLHEQNSTYLNISGVTQKFHGLEHLKCSSISLSFGIANCLKILEVDDLELRFLTHLKLPNLEKLIVNDILVSEFDSIDVMRTAIGKTFHLTIKNIRSDKLLADILKNLKLLNKFQSLNIRSEPMKIMAQNITIQVFDWFFDISYESTKKIFEVRTHSLEKCKKIYSFMADLKGSGMYRTKFELVTVDQFSKVGN